MLQDAANQRLQEAQHALEGVQARVAAAAAAADAASRAHEVRSASSVPLQYFCFDPHPPVDLCSTQQALPSVQMLQEQKQMEQQAAQAAQDVQAAAQAVEAAKLQADALAALAAGSGKADGASVSSAFKQSRWVCALVLFICGAVVGSPLLTQARCKILQHLTGAGPYRML
jgi:hypothetical protein